VKSALIFGVTGQDGAYLSDLLLGKGYDVHGVVRRSSSSNTSRIDHLQHNPLFHAHFGDVTDSFSILRILQEVKPDEVYNLAAQSHVAVSVEIPEYTANADAIGALRILEAIKLLGIDTRFYQASTSELYGSEQTVPQSETTPFKPCSPYAAAKLFAYWTTVNYREAYGLHASNGILFNHESPLRGETFVTRKITRAIANIEAGLQETLKLGNLDARRDWGHAKDYVEGMWLMLQQFRGDDYVLATGQSHSVREFVESAFHRVGYEIVWNGSGVNEEGVDRRSGAVLVEVDPQYFRPTDVNHLLGDPSKAHKILGWRHRVGFHELVAEMVDADLEALGIDWSHRRRIS
jgi:GDPmannose 4,6-dehydratase